MAAKNVENGGLERRPPEAAKNLKDVVLLLAKAIWFNYSQGKKTVAIECAERSDCNLLRGPEVLKELYELKKLLKHTIFFSRKRFQAFLFATGFVKEDVLLRKRIAQILKPAFTVLRDKESKCMLVFIRGTRSIKDTLTDAIAAPVAVSFSHTICSDGDVKRNKVVSGFANRGMVASAGWIRKHCTPILLDALRQYPNFKIKVVGHSRGGGTAALLTYMLREIEQFSSSTCVAFGPAASTSLELAEFGKPFITSIINGSDIVPTLSGSSVRGFIAEGRIKHKNFQNAVGSRLPFVPTAKAIAGHPLTHGSKDPINIHVREKEAATTKESSGTFPPPTKSKQLDIHPLYPPGRIIHIVTSSEDSNSNYQDDTDQKPVYLYETATQLYGKLRVSRMMIFDHLTNKYLQMLNKVTLLEKAQIEAELVLSLLEMTLVMDYMI